MTGNNTPQGLETIDVTPANATPNDSPNSPNVTPNVSHPHPTPDSYPVTRAWVAESLGVSAMTIKRWIDGLAECGIAATEKNGIGVAGYHHLSQMAEYKAQGKPATDYLKLIATPANEAFEAPLNSGGSALVVSHRDNVALATNQALSREANLKAEFFALLSEEQDDRDFEADIEEMRLAKIRERAYREFLQEERESQRIKRELKAAKLALELGGDHNV